MRHLKENGIGSNYKTANTNPISHFNDPRVSVEIYPGPDGKTYVNITCSELSFESGLKTFWTEQEARMYAINLHDQLVTKANSLMESILSRILGNIS
jgi:hypothetical protein